MTTPANKANEADGRLRPQLIDQGVRLHHRIEILHMAKDSSNAPQFVKYVGPVLDALQRLGGSGRPDEMRSLIAERLKLSEEEQSEPLPSKAQPRFDNQVHWARFYL